MASEVNPRNLQIQSYTYELPEERVAKYPLEDRDASRLLIYKDGNISESVYKQLADQIPPGAFMVFNDTKVIEARLIFQKATGGQIEVFCLEPMDTEPSRAMMQEGSASWKCMVGGAGKWKQGKLVKEWEGGKLFAEKEGTVPDGYRIHFSWEPGHLHFAEVLHQAGLIPLPPYLNRSVSELDGQRYQTVYARYDGSVAAPTAGLHFTQEVLESLRSKGVRIDFVTLHVGAGTFKPVKSERMEDHIMHAEWIDVKRSFIQSLNQALGSDAPVIAVGTTALRTLESLYWLGVKVMQGNEPDTLDQWEVYEALPQDIAPTVALTRLLDWMEQKEYQQLMARTQLLIAPGYKLKMARALVTNFHQPGSTLLLLVAALVGEDWKMMYDYALKQGFRFLSYGDGSLLWAK
jgi:S-adenosylmethionine:tRNA ribosyltransferase-isomerase